MVRTVSAVLFDGLNPEFIAKLCRWLWGKSELNAGERNPWNEATEDTASHHTVTDWRIRYTFSHSNSSATGRIEPLHDIMVHHCW